MVGGGAGDVEAADARELAHRLLARRVDVEHADLVGGGQRRPEALGQRLGARVEVRLEDGHQAARAQPAQRLERRRHLGRVVGVVVVDGRAVAIALSLQAAEHPRERRERAGGRLRRRARRARWWRGRRGR